MFLPVLLPLVIVKSSSLLTLNKPSLNIVKFISRRPVDSSTGQVQDVCLVGVSPRYICHFPFPTDVFALVGPCVKL